jgi:hypothetical protein
LPGPLYLRLAPDERGRWSTREVYLQGEWRGVVAGDLRELPLSRIEASVDIDRLARRATEAGPALSVLASHFSVGSFGSQRHDWVRDSFEVQAGARPVKVERRPKTPTRPTIQRLSRPFDGITEDFLRHVAVAYARAVEDGLSPAIELAAQADVPVRTVHRWVYIARQRGVMPPAARGRVT